MKQKHKQARECFSVLMASDGIDPYTMAQTVTIEATDDDYRDDDVLPDSTASHSYIRKYASVCVCVRGFPTARYRCVYALIVVIFTGFMHSWKFCL